MTPTCIVSGRLVYLSGQPRPGVSVMAVSLLPQAVAGQPGTAFAGAGGGRVFTGPDGRWAMTLARGLKVTISIPEANIVRQIQVPDQETYELDS